MTDDLICLLCGDSLETFKWMEIHHTIHCANPSCVSACEECKDDIQAVTTDEPKGKDEGNIGPYPTRQVGALEIERAKLRRELDDQKFGKGSFSYTYATEDRWIGYILQSSFIEWSGGKAKGTEDPRSSYDFLYGSKKIDVKGRANGYTPDASHYVSVPVAHMESGRESSHFVFGWFDPKTQTDYLVGWAEKTSIPKIGKRLEKGEMFHRSRCPVKNPLYDIEIKKLNPMEQLKREI